MAQDKLYKIIFISQGETYEIFAKHVFQGSLYGFIEVEELVFGEKSAVLVDPSEERLKSEFNGVKHTYIPMHAIIRIDEVEKQGTAKIIKPAKSDNTSNITPFPVYTPEGGGSSK